MLICMESAAHIPRLENPQFLERFDLTATYRRDSDVPLLYAPGNTSLYAYGAAHTALLDKVLFDQPVCHAHRLHAAAATAPQRCRAPRILILQREPCVVPAGVRGGQAQSVAGPGLCCVRCRKGEISI